MTSAGPLRAEHEEMNPRVVRRWGRRLFGRRGPCQVAAMLAVGDQVAPSYSTGLWVLSFLAVAAGVWFFRDIPQPLERLRDVDGDLVGGAGLFVVGFVIWTFLFSPVVLAAGGG